MEKEKNNIQVQKRELSGIGGFLYLPLIGIIFSIISVMVALKETETTLETKVFFAAYLFFLVILLLVFSGKYKITRLLFFIFLFINLVLFPDARSVFQLILFSLYFIFSKRVKQTFTKPLSASYTEEGKIGSKAVKVSLIEENIEEINDLPSELETKKIIKTNNKTMSKKLIVILALFVLGALAVVFYWYEWRPSKISSFCNHQAMESAKSIPSEKIRADKYEFLYKECLRDKGL